MTNLEKANTAVFNLLNDDNPYFEKIEPLLENWKPVLAHITQSTNGECFIFRAAWKRKIFIEVRISDKNIICQHTPRIDMYSWNYDKIVDAILEKYPHHLSAQELVLKFIAEDLPKLQKHDRDKNLLIICNIDKWQWNIWYLSMKNDFLKVVAESWLWLNYIVQLQ